MGDIASIDLTRRYKTIFISHTTDKATRIEIVEAIKAMLGELEAVNLNEFMAKYPSASAQQLAAVRERAQAIRSAVTARKSERDIAALYNGVSSVSAAEFDRNNIAVAITEETARYTMYFKEWLDILSKTRNGCAFIYGGDHLDTIEKARAYVKAAGYTGDIDKIRFINKREYKTYAELDIAVKAANSGAKVGIIGTEGELRLQGEMPGMLLEIQPIVMNGKPVYVTIDSLKVLLSMIEMAAEGRLPPGVAKSDIAGIFKYLPRIVPIDYDKEVGAYVEAVTAIRIAA
jgi:hypothetical protein